MEFIDTHCHTHEAEYTLPRDEVYWRAVQAGVTQMIVVGTSVQSSRDAVVYARKTKGVWASIALHPHDAKLGMTPLHNIARLLPDKSIVAIGECGLDYYYNYSHKDDQRLALEFQIDLAQRHSLPLIFHVRDAFDDFWAIIDNFSGIRGVVHSFSSSQKEANECIQRGLYIGLNGIMTFTKVPEQIEMAKKIPLSSIVLETDAPFLTPTPLRGTINEPKNVIVTAKHLAAVRGEDLHTVAAETTYNACQLFGI